MSASFYDTASARFRACRGKLSLRPYDHAEISGFRTGCCTLLQEIAEKAPSADTEEAAMLSRLGLEIAAEIAKTRVREDRADGCLAVRPDACPPDQRKICLELYDSLYETANGKNRMYLAPQIERTPPGPEKCLAILRLYDIQNAEQTAGRQISNRKINRLFGGRG